MAESKDMSEDSDSFMKEEFAHVEELLFSSREECIEIGSKYQDLNNQVQELIKFKEETGLDESINSDHSEAPKESLHTVEEHILKYESQIAAYQHSQSRQAEIVDDLQVRVEEYRKRCAKLEAALAEQRTHEATIEQSESQTQNAFSMDLDTAMIRLEQEKNRCQGLTEINNLLRQQLETATEVNQTLTSDVHRLTKEWQYARSELLTKEIEWKEEEQTFSMHFTNESNILLSMWRQILSFRHDFANLKSSTEKDLSSFKVCICQNIQNIIDVQDPNALASSTKDSSFNSDSFGEKSNKHYVAEKAKLQERVNDLIDRNERIQWLLEEKEKANSALYTTIENISSSFKNSQPKDVSESKEVEAERVCNEYLDVIKSLAQILADDPKSEVSPNSVLKLETTFLETKWEVFTEENFSQFHSVVSNMKDTFKKYSMEIDEVNLKLSNLKEQNSMQQRTIEFLEDEREKMQQLNTQLSSQFESVHLKVQDFLRSDAKFANASGDGQSSCLDVIVKSLKDQIESLHAENSRLLTNQEQLQSKFQDLNEEKRALVVSEQGKELDAKKNLRQIAVLEQNMDSLRKNYLQTQEILQQTTLEKELLEQEKLKFSEILSKLERQCFDLKSGLQNLKDEENVVKDSLVSLQNLSETLSVERDDFLQYLNDATTEIEKLKVDQSQKKIQCEKEKSDMKSKIDSLKERCFELESENENLLKNLQDVESVKYNFEEEKSQMNFHYSDLTDQVTRYSAQKRNAETELEKVREELRQHLELSEKMNLENSSLVRSNTELSMKLESVEGEVNELNDLLSMLNEEKASVEKSLFDAQKTSTTLKEETTDLHRNLDLQKSSVTSLQAEIKELQELHKQYVDEAAKQKQSLVMNMQEIEQEFQVTLKKEQQQHNVDIDILSKEKESLRRRLVSAVDELLESHQKEQEELIRIHEEEVTALKKQIASLETECAEKSRQIQEEKAKVEKDYKHQISALEENIQKLKQELSDNDGTISALEERVFQFEKEKQSIMQEHARIQQKLKDEIEDLMSENSKKVKELKNQINYLKESQESAEENLSEMQVQFKEVEEERNRLSHELENRDSHFKTEKSSKTHLEDRIALLQNQLSDEKSLSEVITKSLEDCRQRLKTAQAENIELKTQIDETHQQIEVIKSDNIKKESYTLDLKASMREIEKSRFELRRDVCTLKKKLTTLERTLKTREQEVEELTYLRSKSEDKEDELKKEIVSLKQKLMESDASTEALTKEIMNTKQKLSSLEHKLKMQQEHHHSTLQESVSNEQTLSEFRLNLERSMVDTSKEVQRLRSALNYEEGKVLALEARVVKLDGAKRDVESRLYSICLFLRSVLRLNLDSGFLSFSTNNIPSSPSPTQRPDSRTSARESPHRLNFSKNAAASHSQQVSVTEQDVELLKSALMDMVEKYSSTENERDNLKDSVTRSQRQEEELRNEHSKCIAKIYQLKRDLEDKKHVEKDLATKIASIYHHEEIIRSLEREKRRINEKVGNLDFSLSAVNKEKEALLERVEEMKKSISKYEYELKAVTKAKDIAETKATKHVDSYQYIETDMSNLKNTISSKEREIRTLEHSLQTTNKKLLASENRNKSLQSTIEKLNSAVEHHIDNEQMLHQKLNNLSSTLTLNSTSQQNLYYEVEKIGKERKKYQTEIASLQLSLDQARQSLDDYKLKNKILSNEVEDLKRSHDQSHASVEDKVKNLEKILLQTKELEKESTQQVKQLNIQKSTLEKKVKELSSLLRECKENLVRKEEACLLLEKEKRSLQKTVEKIEREKEKSSEVTSKSLLENSSLGQSLMKMEIENTALQLKVQNLQAQLAELEERHAQRVKDFLKSQSIEAKLEDDRLRSALTQTEQLMEAREKTHRQRVLGLEEQISVLKSHLEQDKLLWQHYHKQSSNINYLQSVLSKSLQNVSDDPQKLLPEAERLDLTTEIELRSSPGVSVSTPSRLSHHSSSSQIHKTSTPKAKRQLDMSPKS